jgi:hypothetical protein
VVQKMSLLRVNFTDGRENTEHKSRDAMCVWFCVFVCVSLCVFVCDGGLCMSVCVCACLRLGLYGFVHVCVCL